VHRHKVAAGPKPTFERGEPRLADWLRRTSLQDMISAHGHSTDFNGSRAEYLYLRVRLLAIAFAVLAPLWIPIDFLLLERSLFYPILALRLAFSTLFLLLGVWVARPHSLPLARLRLAAFVGIPSLFFVCSRLVLEGLPQAGVLMGYNFLPYLMVSFLAIFPLTFMEGLGFALAMGATFVSTELYFGTLFSISTLGNIWLLGLLAGIAMWAELAQLHMLLQLYREATRDALTGLVNRRALTRQLDAEIELARHRGTPLSVILLDIDLFKRVNDTFGHLTGDAVLQRFAAVLLRELRPHLVGRYGGEEFLGILPAQTVGQAQKTAERIRQACHEVGVLAGDGREVTFTVSIGAAELREGESSDALLNRVDHGLYQAKESGRDLVAVSE
jgi:diguanylate cyclase (GGDEF)-like protein